MDTIFALATAPGKAGVAVIRISGPRALDAGREIAGSLPPFRQTAVRKLRDQQGRHLDDALVIAFPAGHSFTGEPVVELQCHGSIAVVSMVQRALGALDGLRPAEAGEFTRRALENDRLDLVQVEALADLIDAETEAQQQQAQRVMSGELSTLSEAWRRDLIRAAALLEATIDFADEDVPIDVSDEVSALLARTSAALRAQIKSHGITERLRSGFEVAIVGKPNVGKSTLLNALAGREAAITSEVAGTTRDVIEVRMDLGGLPVTLLDTAGLRDATEAVERIGIARARERAQLADLRVFLVEGDDAPDLPPIGADIVVHAKADLYPGTGSGVSGVTGEGIDTLISRLTDELSRRASGSGLAIRERHRALFDRADQALTAAVAVLDLGPDRYDIAAEEIRTAIRALETLTGRIDVESLLDEIFASFCIGK